MRFARPLTALLLLAAAAGSTTVSGATFTSSTSSAPTVVTAGDWTPPVVTLTDPGALLSGTVLISASALDGEGSATTVRIEVAPADSAGWSIVCADAPSPVSCSWDTRSVANGLYDIRAVGLDGAGNAAESVVTGRTVANLP